MSPLNDMMKQELQGIGETLFDEPMSRYTSIRIGGRADALVYPKNLEELEAILAFSRKRELPVFILGAGSNLLVRDKGIRGVVLSLVKGFGSIRREGPQLLYVEAGVGLPRLVDYAAEQGLSGLEPLAGIPGNLGGALTMNAGTSSGDISQVAQSVTFLQRDGRLQTWPREKIRYGYRESHFPTHSVILSARLELKTSTTEAVTERVRADRAKRTETQPLNVPNLGSVFKNPKKGFAGHLIEESGLKDVRVGGARISPKHANFIVNEGEATARDVLALIGLVRDRVKEKFGLLLETEVCIVGEE